MSTISCGYRIYPAWFGGDDATAPMREMARHAAGRMGRQVAAIETTGHGFDRRSGHYLDFKVSYSSTDALQEAR